MTFIRTSQGQIGFLMCDLRLNSPKTVYFDAKIFEHGCLNLTLNPSLAGGVSRPGFDTFSKNAKKTRFLKSVPQTLFPV